MAVSQWKLAWLTPNVGILWISVCSFWLCESIVANPIIYRLVPRPSRFETRQCNQAFVLSNPAFTGTKNPSCVHFFFLPYRPTHLHEREGKGKWNILVRWPNKNIKICVVCTLKLHLWSIDDLSLICDDLSLILLLCFVC